MHNDHGVFSASILQPSQYRYLRYFEEVLNGFIPIDKPLILQRIIMNGIPDIEGDQPDFVVKMGSGESDDEELSGARKRHHRTLCSPYI
jgi:hypothetical protein